MKRIFLSILISTISFALSAQVFDVDTIQYNGSSDTLINVVFLGDGYTADQLDKFVTDAKNTSEVLFTEVPFANYKNYFNVFLIKVPSNVTGAAADPDSLIDNYFGSTYNAYFDIERLLVPMRSSKISNVLAHNFPNYDQVLMIVNDNKYGGSGGWVATFSTNSSAFEICLHELGHSFSKLADEYWAGEQYSREAINMTQQTDTSLVKWKNWYGDFEIGLFPHSESPEWYRPHQNCKMRYLGRDFCAVCRQGIIEKVYSLVSPLISYSPNSPELVPLEFPVSFELELIEPDPNSLKMEWYLNGQNLNTNSDSLILEGKALHAGKNNLSVTVEDTTTMLRADESQTIQLTTINWGIENNITGLKELQYISNKMELSIYPNPFAERLHISIDQTELKEIKIDLVDISGRVRHKQALSTSGVNTLTTSNLEAGNYILRIYSKDTLIGTRKLLKR